MRFSSWIVIITLLLLFNIYTEGYYWKRLVQTYQPKYAQMGLVLIGGILLYISVVKIPHALLRHLLAFLDWGQNQPTGYASGYTSSSHSSNSIGKSSTKTLNLSSSPTDSGLSGTMMYAIRRMTGSAKEATGKRTVSETKKKYVAAQQHWKCHTCGCLLPAWFEVDHIQRVEHGGTNHPDNLVALCRNCHGQKTSLENL
jgi:5-methylcytosine-specific restriction endonuclease McrA